MTMKRIIALFLALFAYVAIAFAAVNINTATKEELDSLPGIGPVKAQAIVDYRTKNGPFKSIDDLKKVSGIGEATFDKIKGGVALSGETKVAPAVEAKKEDKKADVKKEEPKKDEKKAGTKKDDKKADAKKEEPKKDEKKADAKKDDKKADAKKDEKKADAKKDEKKEGKEKSEKKSDDKK
jgi:competence protein ComEA